MKDPRKGLGRICILVLTFIFSNFQSWSQTPVSYTVDQTATSYALKKAFGLPNGKSGVITLNGSNRFICTILNLDGSAAGAYDITPFMLLQNSANNIEINAIGTPNGNIFIVYTSSTSTGISNINAKYLVLNLSGSVVSTGDVNATNLGSTLNRFFDLAVLSNGNVVAMWLQSDNNSGAFRIFTQAGAALTSDVIFAGPGSIIFTSGFLLNGNKVAAIPQGGFVISFYYNGGNFRAIRFDNSGTVQTTGGANAFVVDATAYSGNYRNYRAVGLSNGNYVFFWSIGSAGYYKIINSSGLDVKAKTSVHTDINDMIAANAWVDAAAINTNGSQALAFSRIIWQDYNDLSNPYVKITAYKYDLSGNFLSTADLTSYFIGDYNPIPSLYTGMPSGIGVAYPFFKTYTPVPGDYTLPPEADIAGATTSFTFFPLPVRLVSFQASTQNNKTVLLQWTTASEVNNDGFLLQRSLDGLNYQTIGDVAADPGSTSGRTYQWIDGSPVQGLNYYRLVQVDVDGNRKDLGIRTVKFTSSASTVLIYPNPVTGGVMTIVSKTANVAFELMNVSGSRLQNGILWAGRQQINVSGLPAGVYFLRLQTGESISFEKK